MKKIFAIDDDPEMLEMMTGMLSPLGCSMQFATRCKGAVEKMRQFIPDAILLDVLLPDGSGFEISRSVRADSSLYKTPILFISSIMDGPEVEYALTQGCDAYLGKPFSAKDLTTRLNDLHALAGRINQPSTGTNFLTLEAITREIDHCVFQQRAFALCYLSIEDFDAYQVIHGHEEAMGLIDHVCNAIRRTLVENDLRGTAIAHLGREYFLALLPPASYDIFCRQVELNFSASAPHGISLRIDVSLRNESHAVGTHVLLHELQNAHKKHNGSQQPTLFRWDRHRNG
ncbi:MAG TPA: response regulator [Candidatus Hydrogenedentes bacterium]|nr:response regulator [Candidatus Hydrogenedentota bacterium]